MTTLRDGTVIPSFLSVAREPTYSADLKRNDFALRSGRVVGEHAPGAASNTNKHFWEYDVKVGITNGGAFTEVLYPRCQISSSFGGAADRTRWTPRIGKFEDPTYSSGTRVLVLCINGETENAVIIGGFNSPATPDDPAEPEAPLYSWEFNGVLVEVHPNGDLKLYHKGATKADGSVEDDDPTKNGTSIVLDANGDVRIGTGKESKNLVHLDSQNKKIFIDATEGEVHIKAAEHVRILSSGVLTGDATDHTMMGDTYRTAQIQMHNTVMPLLTSLSSALATAGAGIGAAAVSHTIPVAGPILGSPMLATAAGAILSAAPLVSQIMAAIQTFESKSQTYLSKKNKSD